MSIQFTSDIKCIHSPVQWPPLSISRTCSSSQTVTLYSLSNNSLFLPSHHPWEPSILLSVSEFACSGHLLCGWVTRYLSFCDCLLSLSIMSSGLARVGMCQNLIPFKVQIIFHCMYKAYFICSFICWWPFIEMFYFFRCCLLKSGMYFTLRVYLILFGPTTSHLLSSHCGQ